MAHKMGLVRLNPTTKNVATTLTYTYDKADGGYTSSTSGTSTITASNDFTGNKPYAINSQYWHIVKSTGISTNTAMEFTCNANQKDYWSTKSSGTDIGHGKYKVIDIQSDREAANFVALFSCVGKCQEITLPWYDTYKMECWGAQGGDLSRTFHSSGNGLGPTPFGGRGAYVAGHIVLPCNKYLYVYVGEQGGNDQIPLTNSFNGGGIGKDGSITDGCGARGGGATDIRTNKHSESDGWSGAASLNTRIIVAAGGGGCTNYGTVYRSASDYAEGDGTGGAAGGLRGYPGLTTTKQRDLSATTNATGGTQNDGGSGFKQNNALIASSDGGLGFGGSSTLSHSAGAGSGYYGGGSGGVFGGVVASGAGGSSFISGHPGCKTISGYVFTSGTTKMIDGKGLTWTTSSQTTGGTAERMPTTSGGQEALNTGHSGNGYAKITSQ